MSNQSTIELLREMKFSAMAAEFITQLEDPSAYKDLDFEERFSLLVDVSNHLQIKRSVDNAHCAKAGINCTLDFTVFNKNIHTV